MSDYPGVVVASLIYLSTVMCALMLSAWLGIGVYFWPEVALKPLGFSFQDYSKGTRSLPLKMPDSGLLRRRACVGVYFLCASASIILLAFLWRSVAWCGRRYKRVTSVEAPLPAKLP